MGIGGGVSDGRDPSADHFLEEGSARHKRRRNSSGTCFQLLGRRGGGCGLLCWPVDASWI